MHCPSHDRDAQIRLAAEGGVQSCSLWQGSQPECRGECLFEPRVGDIMTREVQAVSDTTSLAELAEVLSARKISGVPVVGANRHLLGVVSSADLLSRQDPGFYEAPVLVDEVLDGFVPEPSRQVRDVMSHTLHTVEEDTFVSDAVELMLRHQIHRVLVTRGRELVGIVTTTDLMRVLASVLRQAPRRPAA